MSKNWFQRVSIGIAHSRGINFLPMSQLQQNHQWKNLDKYDNPLQTSFLLKERQIVWVLITSAMYFRVELYGVSSAWFRLSTVIFHIKYTHWMTEGATANNVYYRMNILRYCFVLIFSTPFWNLSEFLFQKGGSTIEYVRYISVFISIFKYWTKSGCKCLTRSNHISTPEWCWA